MQVIRALSAGFCLGVSLALRCLDQELKRYVKTRETEQHTRLITFGPIIHNPLVMRRYTEQGVMCESDWRGVGRGDRIIIRAHGISRGLEQDLKESGAAVVDATCPRVKKAQISVTGACAKGGNLVLFGEKEHPEVRGLLSYADADALVFANLEELDNLPLDRNAPYFLAAQTTQERVLFQEAHKRLSLRLGKQIPLLDTICDATRRRQQEVIDLAAKVEAMVVVGGFNSGNTRRLAEIARGRGIPTLHAEHADDLTPNAVRAILGKIDVAGLTAGASTPEEHITTMQSFLESL